MRIPRTLSFSLATLRLSPLLFSLVLVFTCHITHFISLSLLSTTTSSNIFRFVKATNQSNNHILAAVALRAYTRQLRHTEAQVLILSRI